MRHRPRSSRAAPLLLALLAAVSLDATALASTAEAQFWTKAREAARKAEEIAKLLSSAIRCTFTDQTCIDGAKATNKPVVLTDASGKVITDGEGNPVTDPTKLPPEHRAAAASSNAGESASQESEFGARTTVERLGAPGAPMKLFRISDDGAHAAVPALQGSRKVIIVDGQPGPAFDEIDFATVVFSSTGGHHAYVGQRGGDCIVVIDGREVHAWASTACGSGSTGPMQLQFNRDGSHWAFMTSVEPDVVHGRQPARLIADGGVTPLPPMTRSLILRGGRIFLITQQSVYVDGRPGPEFRDISPHIVVSDDGRHYAYVGVLSEGRQQVVIDGEAGEIYSRINELYMEPASGSVYYTAAVANAAGQSSSTVLFADGRAYRESELGGAPAHGSAAHAGRTALTLTNGTRVPNQTMALSFGATPRHAFAVRTAGQGVAVWVDGKLGREYQDPLSDLQFTGDGSRVVYAATSGGRGFVVVDDEESGPHGRGIENLIVSERGSSYAFSYAEDGREWIVNGESIGTKGTYGKLVLSPDGSRYAVSGSDVSGHFVIVDGERSPHMVAAAHNLVTPNSPQRTELPQFVFSADGKRLAYAALVTESGQPGNALVLDGAVVAGPGKDGYVHLMFSPSGRHFAYLRLTSRLSKLPLHTLYIDGRPGPVVAEELLNNANALSFVDENTIRIIALLDGELVKHTIRIE